jgi:hypothetical protein
LDNVGAGVVASDPDSDALTRRQTALRQLSELVRGLTGKDLDARDEATEELGRRLRGEAGSRIAAYLQAAGAPSDPDIADRVARLLAVRRSIEHLEESSLRLQDLRQRVRLLRRRIDAWERYQEDAEPGTSTGLWVVENQASIDRLLGMFRARSSQLEAELMALEESIGREQALLDEAPGATRGSSSD